MKRSNRLILLIGILLAAIAFVGVVLLLGNQGGGGGVDDQARNETTVVVAAQDIELGATLTDALVETETVREEDAPAGAFTLESEVIGRTVTTQLTKGQLIDANAFAVSTVNPDVARLLDPGKRAISVQVDQVSGVGTLIKPGDRVDVVLAFTEDQAAKYPITVEKAPTREGDPEVTVRNFEAIDPLLSNTSVKVLVENLRVVGTLLPPPEAQEGAPEGEDGTAAPALTGQAQLVLLEVTPQQAELIRFTQLDGNLSLVLRAPGDAEAPPVATTGITVRQLVDSYGVLPPKIILTEQP